MSRFSSTIYWSDFCFPHKIIWPLKAGFISWLPVLVCWYVYSLPLLLICIIYKERFVLLIWKAKRAREGREGENECESLPIYWFTSQVESVAVAGSDQSLPCKYSVPKTWAIWCCFPSSISRELDRKPPEPGLELVLVWDTLIKVVVLPQCWLLALWSETRKCERASVVNWPVRSMRVQVTLPSGDSISFR